MENVNNNVGVVILAAGQGTRLGSTDKPKVMLEIGGNPVVSYIVKTLEEVGFSKEQICLVVGFQKEVVQSYFGDRVSYAIQDEQLGTAHAAYVGSILFPSHIDTLLIIGGDDSAFYTKDTVSGFVAKHKTAGVTLSLLTTIVDNPGAIGRVIRDDQNAFLAVKEKEEISEEETLINEISTGTYCIDRAWYERMFPDMKQIEGLGEYGLNTAVVTAVREDQNVQAIVLDDGREWFGINTKEEWGEADRRKQ